jgi:hypothetical protein
MDRRASADDQLAGSRLSSGGKHIEPGLRQRGIRWQAPTATRPDKPLRARPPQYGIAELDESISTTPEPLLASSRCGWSWFSRSSLCELDRRAFSGTQLLDHPFF